MDNKNTLFENLQKLHESEKYKNEGLSDFLNTSLGKKAIDEYNKHKDLMERLSK